jgi:8-oxo-dGTP pyrophosphatase MutT (NUDIX family)
LGYVEDLRKIVGHLPIILVGAVVVIVDPQGRILLQQRKYPYGAWGLPGGLMELGESAEETARREVMEETNLNLQDLTLINVYSGSGHYVKSANGDEFYVVTVAYYTEQALGDLKMNKEESLAMQYFYPEQIPDRVVKSHRQVIDEFLQKHYHVAR